MKFKKLSHAFIFLFLLIILVFIPGHSLTPPLSIKATFSWIGITMLVFLVAKNLIKASQDEYSALVTHIKGKIPSFKGEIVESSMALWLSYSGLTCWFLMALLKDIFFPLPLLILGATLMVWGLSIFLEENGVYKFSESRLSNKWVLSAIASAVLYWAGFKSAGQVNSVFGIDPGFFPFTLAAMILVNVIVLFCLIMLPVLLVLVGVTLLKFVNDISGKHKSKESMIFSVVLAFSAYASIIGIIMQFPEAQENIVRSIALKTDFNSTHLCKGDWLKDKAVIFVGPNSSYVLTDSNNHEGKYEIYKCISFSKVINSDS
ncbi:hypothetical protein [Pseudomonas sp. RL_15y_Pfl2_60]|uniref:hypothetical protein n=1 Tax=Pseudomonas sp. RL_15y_Pfl2_60 TaxID=3088709 RepID=UPI0030DD5046